MKRRPLRQFKFTALTQGLRWLRVSLVFLLIAAGAFFFVVPMTLDRVMNGVHVPGPYTVGASAEALFEQITVADLHADTLLWDRRLERRHRRGHIDLVRLLESGVAVQVFSAVTKTPRNLNFERNDSNTDNITLLSIAQRWPTRTWTNLSERALFQAQRLRDLAEAANDKLILIETQDDLADLLAARARGDEVVGAVLAIEGMHAAAGSHDTVLRLFDAGYRIMGLTHFFDNEIGGSAHGMSKGGLTEFGRMVVASMSARNIIVDLAHASPALINDVLAISSRPIVVSHTGVKGTCDRTRNLSDQQLQAIAEKGGLVGIAFFSEAVCGETVAHISAAIRYTVDQIGVRHVAFGSDFDGAVTTPFDISGLKVLIESLLRHGFSEAEITAIAGGNLIRFLLRNLPAM